MEWRSYCQTYRGMCGRIAPPHFIILLQFRKTLLYNMSIYLARLLQLLGLVVGLPASITSYSVPLLLVPLARYSSPVT